MVSPERTQSDSKGAIETTTEAERRGRARKAALRAVMSGREDDHSFPMTGMEAGDSVAMYFGIADNDGNQVDNAVLVFNISAINPQRGLIIGEVMTARKTKQLGLSSYRRGSEIKISSSSPNHDILLGKSLTVIEGGPKKVTNLSLTQMSVAGLTVFGAAPGAPVR